MKSKKMAVFSLLILLIIGSAGASYGKTIAFGDYEQTWCTTDVEVWCRDEVSLDSESWDAPGCPAESYDSVQCAVNFAAGWAYANGVSDMQTRPHIYVGTPGYAGADKVHRQDGMYVETDPIRLQADTVSANTMQFTFSGKVRMVPSTPAVCRLQVSYFQNNDTSDVFFRGVVTMNGSTNDYEVTGLFDPADFTLTTYTDYIELEFNFTRTDIPFEGPHDGIGGILVADPHIVDMSAVPSLTDYGIAILVVLMVITGIIIIRKRRRFATG